MWVSILTKHKQFQEHSPSSSGKTFIYTWTVHVRPDTSWVNGYAPLEVFVQFNTNDTDDLRITFDVLTAYIIDELWENYSQANTTKTYSSTHPSVDTESGLEFGSIIGAVLLFCIFIRSRRNAHWKLYGELIEQVWFSFPSGLLICKKGRSVPFMYIQPKKCDVL